MLEENTLHSGEMINIVTQLMSTYFQKTVHFSQVIQLSEENRRNLILRLVIDQPTAGMPDTLILKKTATEKNVFEAAAAAIGEIETEQEQLTRFSHDWAGLEFLTQIGSNHAPHFYIGCLEYKFIIIEDLGLTHPSLVGPLIRVPSAVHLQEAENALLGYMRRLGKMHADTAAKSHQFVSILNRVYPDALRFIRISETDGIDVLNQFKQLVGIESKELNQEVNNVLEFSQTLTEFSVLLHGDICPDNVYYQDNETRFIDFEFGDFGNALIDGVYLRMHMPSCWCSKAVPKSILDQMESAYRTELIKGIPAATDDAIYNKQLVYACAYWLLRTIKQIKDVDLIDHEWICPSGPIEPDSEWKPEENAFRPRILSRLDAFISCAETTNHLPKLKDASKHLLSYLRNIWPQTQFIDLFPVFK